METRKIYMTGGATYVVSLPKRWVESSGLKQGDSVVVTREEGAIIIEPGIIEKTGAEVEIKVSEVPSGESLERLIISYYLVGYDTIKIHIDRKDHLDYKDSIRKALNLLIGVELVEDIGNRVTMEILLDHQRMPTTKVLRKIHLINKSMLGDLITAFKSKDTNLVRDVMQREKEVDRLYFLVVRQLKSAVRYHQVAEKLGITYQRDSLGYRIVVKSLERIADHLENISQSYLKLADIEENPEMGDILKLATQTLSLYERATTAIFKHDPTKVEEVFTGLKKIERVYSKASNKLFSEKINVHSSLLRKTIIDSFRRIAGYSTDIAEIAINMSVKVP
jgi:phosphate uptake regulator